MLQVYNKKSSVGAVWCGGGDFFAFFAWILSLSVVIRCYLFFCLAFLPVFALNFSAAFIAVVYCEYCGVLGGLVGEFIIGGK